MANGFDKEYSTMFFQEVDYLTSIGIIHSFSKTNEYGKKIYKYEKTVDLFKALVEFYKSK